MFLKQRGPPKCYLLLHDILLYFAFNTFYGKVVFCFFFDPIHLKVIMSVGVSVLFEWAKSSEIIIV